MQQAVHQTFEANLQEGTGQVTGFTFPFETNEHGTIRHVRTVLIRPYARYRISHLLGRVLTFFCFLHGERDTTQAPPCHFHRISPALGSESTSVGTRGVSCNRTDCYFCGAPAYKRGGRGWR